jgi:hypothetical protein
MPFDPVSYARATEALNASTVAVANAAVRRTTLALLNAVTGADVGAVGEVFDEPANNGSYRWDGSAWDLVSTATIPSLDTRVSELETEYSDLITDPLPRTVGRLIGDTASWSFTRSTPAWGFGPLGTLVETAIDTLRWEFNPTTLAPLGVAFAGARTNVVTNPRAEGAGAGTPGTRPTGWQALPAGVTSEIIGTTTINGISGVVVRLVGTPTTTATQLWPLNAFTTCTIGLTQCAGVYAAILGGSMTNIDGISLRNRSNDDGAAISPTWTSTPRLYERRWVAENSTSIAPTLRWGFLDTVTPVDITFFVGAVQQRINQPFLDAPILPPIGTPGASTRAQGNVNVPIEQLGTRYNRRQGTVIVDWTSQSGAFTSALDTDFFGILSLGDLGANEVMGVLVNPAHTSVEFRRIVGGVAQTAASVTQTAPDAGVTTRVAFSWDIDAGLMQVAARGVAGTQLTGQTSIPSITHVMPGRFSTTRPLFGGLPGLEIRPAAIFGSTLAALTA